jgi:rRNA small subunit aminocarboxypropyltransferase
VEGERPQDGRGQQGLQPLRALIGAPLDVLVFRDPRESARKCSLTPLRGRPGIRFVTDRPGARPPLVLDAGRRILLHPDGDELRPEDRGPGLLLIDCSWRRVEPMLRRVRGELAPRRLPALLRTAYPRRNRQALDPAGGLASVEALYAALHLLGEPRPDLLEGYPWAAAFLAANPSFALPAGPARLGPSSRLGPSFGSEGACC